jgi:hypothetical protein
VSGDGHDRLVAGPGLGKLGDGVVSEIVEAQASKTSLLRQPVPCSLPGADRARWVKQVDAHSMSVIASARLERCEDIVRFIGLTVADPHQQACDRQPSSSMSCLPRFSLFELASPLI